MPSFISQLSRRKVFKAGATYASAVLLIVSGCVENSGPAMPGTNADALVSTQTAPENSTGTRIVNADAEPQNWLSHGRSLMKFHRESSVWIMAGVQDCLIQKVESNQKSKV